MNILVTGATGFIGRNLVEKLLTSGYNVFCTLLENEINPFKGVGSVVVDLKNLKNFVSFLRLNKIEGVVHLASFVQSGEHVVDDVEKLIHANILFSTVVLDASVCSEVKWFINTGTYWQNYGGADYSPVNLYAATKQAFQSIAQYYIDTKKIQFYTIKLYDTYGPADTRVKIFNLWDKISRTGQVLDMSPGEQFIDISHVDDVVSAYLTLILVLEKNSSELGNGAVFAVSAVMRYTLKELAEEYQRITNKKIKVNWGGRAYKDREVMDPWRGKMVPGWRPTKSLSEGLNEMDYD